MKKTKYGDKSSHNPILAVRRAEGGTFMVDEIGYTRQDCIDWIKRTKATESEVVFARRLFALKADIIEVVKVKEVPNAKAVHGPEKKVRKEKGGTDLRGQGQDEEGQVQESQSSAPRQEEA